MNIWIDFFRVAIPLLVLLVALPALAARIGAGNSAVKSICGHDTRS